MRLAPLLFLLLSCLASASAVTPKEAKANADKSEASLPASELTRLTQLQGQLAASAFPACAQRTGSAPETFTVVVELSPAGAVVNSWLLGGTAFAQCFREAMVRSFTYRPPNAPFFTAFEYTHAR